MIRLAEERDFLQLAEMKWEHSAEDDVTYGESNIVGVDKQQFIDEFVDFLKNDTTYTVFVMELDGIVVSAMYVAIINKVPKPKVSNYCLAYLTNVHTLEAYRNKGYGTQLLTYIKNYLKERNCEMVIVWPSKNSTRWYERNEFNPDNSMMQYDF